MRAVLLSSAWLALGCASPIEPELCPALDASADLAGTFEHVMILEDGRRSEPVEVVWSRQEDYLYALDSSAGARLVFAVEGWLEVEERPGRPCGVVVVDASERPPTTRSHLRVDWSEELAVAARDLLGPDVESVPLWVGDDAALWRDRLPMRERDADGRLERLTLWTRYLARGEDTPVAVRHELARVR